MSPQLLSGAARLAGGSLLRLQSDERLVALVRDGHDPAFSAVVERYRVELLRYAVRLVGDVAGRGRRPAGVPERPQRDEGVRRRAAAAAVALPDRPQRSLNVLRSARQDEALDDHLAGSGAGTADDLETRERLREALVAISRLPEPQRDALTLRALEGRSHVEIAEALGVTPGAARQHLHRARTTVRAAVSAITPYGLMARFAMAGGGEPAAAADRRGVRARRRPRQARRGCAGRRRARHRRRTCPPRPGTARPWRALRGSVAARPRHRQARHRAPRAPSRAPAPGRAPRRARPARRPAEHHDRGTPSAERPAGGPPAGRLRVRVRDGFRDRARTTDPPARARTPPARARDRRARARALGVGRGRPPPARGPRGPATERPAPARALRGPATRLGSRGRIGVDHDEPLRLGLGLGLRLGLGIAVHERGGHLGERRHVGVLRRARHER